VDKSTTAKKTTDQAQNGVWSTNHTLFLGEYRHKMDQKGRLAMPVKFRAGISDGAVVTKGMDGCLYLFSLEQWNPIAEKLANQPVFSNTPVRRAQREVLASATPVTPDRQGRILLPPHLREYGGLGSGTAEVVVAGLYNRVEIWPAAKWRKERKESDLDQIGPQLADLGI
jgi:transcriptional regulator MraZ